MWTCPKCMYENTDRNVVCESCGSGRNNRRFSTPTVQNAPYSVQRTQPSPYARDVSASSGQVPVRKPRQSETPVPPPLSKSSKLLRLCGYLLTLLLPLLCVLLCWKQFDALYKALVPLLTGNAEINAGGIMCYVFFCTCAFLLSLLPGLSALSSTGRYKKRKVNEDSRLI